MSILVYQDYVHNNGVIFRRLLDSYAVGTVRPCDADDILGGILETARLLVMPGGADLYQCEKLNGDSNAAIRAFVEQGGTYLGICAGAYYACASIEWAKDKPESICGPRELAFYNGTATGPIYDLIEDGNIAKSWDGIAMLDCNGNPFPAFYNAGPVFSGDDKAAILARYTALPGQPPAIVECTVDKGRAILSGPHIEYDAAQYRKTLYRCNNASYKWQSGIAEQLDPGQEQQGDLWRAILKRALPDVKQKDAA